MVPRQQLPVLPSFPPLPVRTDGRTDGGWPIFYLPIPSSPLLSSPLPSFLSGLGERCHRVWFVFVRTPAARFIGRSFPFPKLADGEVLIKSRFFL